ncbi:MAG: DNA polymerase III subunit gamma/tau [Gemmatimonadota bacterium]
MSSTRTALARLYRPRRFAEMATQEHVSETLKSAVANQRVAHAYLFTGPRGVGKTTAARVLAMALNCPNRIADGEPCGACESCEKIWSGKTSLDVVEIDAASNRGVDDARDLRERAMYAPTDEKRYKVYIVDEAHMLTREAWNALLKILEEPPPRVIFVFATTEPQKIQQSAAPIMSRVQRFDFRRISVQDIVTRLQEVLAAEQVEAEPDALTRIARRAEGGMRDALSLLDQVLSFTGGRVLGEDVGRVLGLAGDELYLDLFEILAERRPADVFRFVQRVLDEGYDLSEFYRGLADAIRAVMLVKLEGERAADLREDLRPRYLAAADAFAIGDLLRMLAQVAEMDTEGRLRKATNPRLLLEALLLRFAYLDRSLELEELMRVAGGSLAGGAAPSAPGGPRSNRAEPAPRTPVRESMPVPRSQPDPSAAPSRPLSVQQALQSALQTRTAQVPNGLAIFLRVASATEPQPGQVVLEMPAGPGLERLRSEPATRRALEVALSDQLGRPIALEPRAAPVAAASPPEPVQRLTVERVKAEQLSRLTAEEPTLKKAAEEWNLELLE